MEAKQGFLLISDISGYTRFLVESELGHAKEILDSLLKSTIDAIRAPIRVLSTRGDAVVAFVADEDFRQPQTLLESIEAIYFDFRRQLEFMDVNTTCTCQACANMSALDLKVFLHHGEYIEQDLAGTVELQGADVILANLLMKNHVKEATGLFGYGLITEPAITAMRAESIVMEMTVHYETYEHFGQVGMRIWDLPSKWSAEKARTVSEPDPAAAWVVESIEVPVPQWVAWDHATDERQKRRYYDMESVNRVDDLGGLVRTGAQFHCVHKTVCTSWVTCGSRSRTGTRRTGSGATRWPLESRFRSRCRSSRPTPARRSGSCMTSRSRVTPPNSRTCSGVLPGMRSIVWGRFSRRSEVVSSAPAPVIRHTEGDERTGRCCSMTGDSSSRKADTTSS